MTWSNERLQQWFEDNDIGDLVWEESRGREDGGYVLRDYDRKGYNRSIIESCFTYNKKDGSWDLVDDNNGVKWVEHEEYNVQARITDNHFKFFIPQLQPPRTADLAEYGKYQELKAMLAGAPTPMGNNELDEMDYFLEWHLTDHGMPAYP